MQDHAARPDRVAAAIRIAAWVALAAAAVGVFLTWTSTGPVRLDGLQGPNNGWLVLIFAGLGALWNRSAARGSWTGIVGVLGASVVMAWTAVENWLDSRDVFGATAGAGLLLVVVASVALAGTAVARGVVLVRGPRTA